MRVMILHNAVSTLATTDERDVLVQVEAVASALQRLGHSCERLACTLDLETVRGELQCVRPDVIFNLVESLGGSDRLIHVLPVLLDTLGIAYTGVPTEALFLSTSKLLAKEKLERAGLPTPAWQVGTQTERLKPPYVIKAVWEHASFGMDEQALVSDESYSVNQQLSRWRSRWLRDCFAEQYIDGREFNLSLLEGNAGVEVLPPAEIDFSHFPPGMPRMVNYQAKWEENSFEYQHTPRHFEFHVRERELLAWLGSLAQACWHLFGLRGYARVDFRVDPQGNPWILEINANPCLSPDAGFAAALERAGIGFDQAIQRIISVAGATNNSDRCQWV